jgi:glycosyltransferase involved in cell wall biosynthesis
MDTVMTGSAPLFSVVICTYNRAELLRGALESLARQQLDPACFEVLVVDNGSTDQTGAVAAEFCARQSNVRYIVEPRQGLSHARNRGFAEARGSYIAYSDDDNRLPPEWLGVASAIVRREGVRIFGGPSRAFFLTARPRWFGEGYGVFSPEWQARDLREGEFLCGNNFFVHKSLLAAIGGFDPQMGMQGDKLGYGEETELLERVRARLPDERCFYDPRLFVYHVVRPNKLTLRWRARQQFATGRYCYHLFNLADRQGRLPLLAQALARAAWLAGEMIYAVAARDRRRYPYLQNYLYERASRHLVAYGIAYERLRAARSWL